MFSFYTYKSRNRLSLTPMIDVVFLLLVFFMLASHFEKNHTIVIENKAAGMQPYQGPARLVSINGAEVFLNGQAVGAARLADALTPLIEDRNDTIIIQPLGDTNLQQMLSVMDNLSDSGFTSLVVIE